MSEAERAVVDAVRAGDESAFTGLVERHRRELQVHCYRMLGSFDDAEDLVQETFLRAWRNRAGFEGRATFRTWLYRIATNACLDFLERRPRRPRPREAAWAADPGLPPAPGSEISWLQPYPDSLLEPAAPDEARPDATVVAKETIELAFLAAIQHLPPRQRAVLILRDVLGWPAADTAAALDMTVPAVKSALQRARPALRDRLPERRADWAPATAPTREERALLARYVTALEQSDPAALAKLLREDALFTMPPQPWWWYGRDAIADHFREYVLEPFRGRIRVLPTTVNRQCAVAVYLREPDEAGHRGRGFNVLRVEDGLIAELTGFFPDRFPSLGLPGPWHEGCQPGDRGRSSGPRPAAAAP